MLRLYWIEAFRVYASFISTRRHSGSRRPIEKPKAGTEWNSVLGHHLEDAREGTTHYSNSQTLILTLTLTLTYQARLVSIVLCMDVTYFHLVNLAT